MTVAARRVAAIPVRTSTQTWHAVVELLARVNSPAASELLAITNVAAILISEEYTAQAPIVVSGGDGPRVRIYTVHGTDAIHALDDELPLASFPTDGTSWSVSLPCGVDDFDDLRDALGATKGRIDFRDVTQGITLPDAAPTATRGRLQIDLGELNRP